MIAAGKKHLRLPADEAGQTTLEWALLLVAVALPLLYVFTLLLSILSRKYQTVVFFQTLPFP